MQWLKEFPHFQNYQQTTAISKDCGCYFEKACKVLEEALANCQYPKNNF